MMTRMSAVAPKERISSGLSMMRERGAAAGPTRRDKLLGISPGSPSPSPSPLALDSDGELKEEDVWGGDENLAEDPDSSSDNQSQQQHSRLVKNGRQWLGLEKDASTSPLGLSSINRPSPNAGRDTAPVPVRKMATASRMIPHVSSGVFDHSCKMIQQHQSAPVNIPDWSKILGMDKRSATNKENGFALDQGGEEELEGDESDGGEEETSKIKKKKNRLPPHELAAREYAKSHTAFSVYEGAGRTLKGMDLRRVRNAVWMQTGFMGG